MKDGLIFRMPYGLLGYYMAKKKLLSKFVLNSRDICPSSRDRETTSDLSGSEKKQKKNRPRILAPAPVTTPRFTDTLLVVYRNKITGRREDLGTRLSKIYFVTSESFEGGHGSLLNQLSY